MFVHYLSLTVFPIKRGIYQQFHYRCHSSSLLGPIFYFYIYVSSSVLSYCSIKHDDDDDDDDNDVLDVQGEYLLRGSRLVDFSVRLGDRLCDPVSLNDSQLDCRPPFERPHRNRRDSFCPRDKLSLKASVWALYSYYNVMFLCNRFHFSAADFKFGQASHLSKTISRHHLDTVSNEDLYAANFAAELLSLRDQSYTFTNDVVLNKHYLNNLSVVLCE